MLRGLIVLASLAVCYGLSETLIINDDSRHSFHIVSFGFEKDGKVEFTVKDFQLMIPHDYVVQEGHSYNIAFVLQHSTSDVAIRTDEASPDFCFHESKVGENDQIITMKQRSEWALKSFDHKIVESGYYHLYYSNCEKGTHSTFQMALTEYNVDPSTGDKIYLSAGQQALPTWFFLLCFLFVAQLVAWLGMICKGGESVRSIHYLMAIVLIFKILCLFCEAFKYHALKVTGHNDGWSVVFYIFSTLKGTLLFAVIVLIGTGWSYLKPFLTERDKQIMIAVLVVQMMVNIAMVVLDEMAPGSAGWLTWSDLLHLLDIICCCVILLPIVWSIRHLRAAAGVDGKASRNMDRLKNFRTFYLSVVAYIYFTRIIVYLLGATLPFEMTWVGTVFSEMASFIFYASTGYLFRPQEKSPYLALNKDDDDLDAAELDPL